MINAILNILTFPFRLVSAFIFKIDKTTANKVKPETLIALGDSLFVNYKTDFEAFFNLFLTDKQGFLNEHKKLLKRYDNFNLDELRALDVIYIFGDSKQRFGHIDNFGEENEGEIEEFLNDLLQIPMSWTNAKAARIGIFEDEQMNRKFILKLFKAIDQDLKSINKKLIFLELGWDVYIYTVIDQVFFETITTKFGAFFYGTEKLI